MKKMPHTQLTHQNTDASPTLEDVAKMASVSTATVSRCLNTPSVVSQNTRERVLEAVKALGYTPNFGAQALAAKRTKTFGAIIPTMENAIFARSLQAFQEELQRCGITLLVSSSSYSPELEEEQIHGLVARGADALLLIGFNRSQHIYKFLEKQKVPCVIAWVYDPSQPMVSIGFDNRKAMQSLVSQVLKLGHKSLALITAELNGNDRAQQRYEGLLKAMEACGLDAQTLRVIKTTYSITNGAKAFETLMQSDTTPTAVICGNDVLAAGALVQARNMGLNVPNDVSITGFDDIEIAELVTPALTTVHVPHRKMGKGAAEMLIALRDGKNLSQSVELEATIKLRGSLGPVPKIKRQL